MFWLNYIKYAFYNMCSNETALFKARNIFQYDRLSDTCCVLMAVAPPLNNARQTRDFSGCSQLQFISGYFVMERKRKMKLVIRLVKIQDFKSILKIQAFKSCLL